MVVPKQSMEHNMWTEITRPKYERAGRRYSSDLTDAEWRVIEPYMPAVKRLSRLRETDLRAIVDAILYIARTGCQWRLLPKDFPPFTTVQGYFYDWRDQNLFERINFELLLQAREAAGREPSPSAGRHRQPIGQVGFCRGGNIGVSIGLAKKSVVGQPDNDYTQCCPMLRSGVEDARNLLKGSRRIVGSKGGCCVA